jgi:hypothetical protein
MEERLSCSVELHQEDIDGKTVFVADCIELGISDFGDNVNEAISNLRKGINLLLEEMPQKKELLREQRPVMITRLLL